MSLPPFERTRTTATEFYLFIYLLLEAGDSSLAAKTDASLSLNIG